jgi:two-component system nitrate/nitrite response regulator NarL
MLSLNVMKDRMPKLVSPQIRLVLIDSYTLSRAGIQAILAEKPGLDIVGEAASGTDAIALVQLQQPDIILLNIASDAGKSLERIPEMLAAAEESRLLVLTGDQDVEIRRKAVRLGAIGVLTLDNSPDILMKAIERIHHGEAWLDRSMTASVLSELSPVGQAKKIDPEEEKIKTLTPRELQIIQLVGEGLKNRTIGERLFISEITVHHHLTSIYSKLELSDRLELIVYSYKNGLAQLPA